MRELNAVEIEVVNGGMVYFDWDAYAQRMSRYYQELFSMQYRNPWGSSGGGTLGSNLTM